MVLHDVSDVMLEASKLCQYTNLNIGKDIGFVLFAITFFVTRLVMYAARRRRRSRPSATNELNRPTPRLRRSERRVHSQRRLTNAAISMRSLSGRFPPGSRSMC